MTNYPFKKFKKLPCTLQLVHSRIDDKTNFVNLKFVKVKKYQSNVCCVINSYKPISKILSFKNGK